MILNASHGSAPLIEEAAGITKYKAGAAPRAQARSRAANLTRLEDIIYEIDRQRGSLKRQAAKARRYTRLPTRCAAGKVLSRGAIAACPKRSKRPGAVATTRARTRQRRRRVSPKSRTNWGGFGSTRHRDAAATTPAAPCTRTSSRSTGGRRRCARPQQAEMLKKRARSSRRNASCSVRREPSAWRSRPVARPLDSVGGARRGGALAAAAAEETRARGGDRSARADVETGRADVYAVLTPSRAHRGA